MDGHVGIAPTIPVWKTDVYLSTLMPEWKWNPVLELHQPLRLCRPPPELLGQRDVRYVESFGKHALFSHCTVANQSESCKASSFVKRLTWSEKTSK